MSTQPQVAAEKMIFRKTNAQLGRHISVTPANSSMRRLAYGRILLNSSIPGRRICFLWAMAAHREVADRQFGVVNVQPGFNQGPTGLEAGRKN